MRYTYLHITSHITRTYVYLYVLHIQTYKTPEAYAIVYVMYLAHMYVRMYVHMYIHTYVLTYMHVHTCTHVSAGSKFGQNRPHCQLKGILFGHLANLVKY